MRFDHRRTRLAAMVAAGALLLAGCGGDDDTGEGDGANTTAGTYVGTVEGSDAYVALISDGERVTGYLCDGRKVSSWLAPTGLADGGAELISRKGDRLGEVTVSEEGATGVIEVAGKAHDFDAEPATGDAGLYRAAIGKPGKPGSVEAGWIVLADGSVKGAKNSFMKTDIDLVVQPAPRFTPGFMKTGADFAVDLGPGGKTAVEPVGPSFVELDVDF